MEAEVVKFICANQGAVSYEDLICNISSGDETSLKLVILSNDNTFCRQHSGPLAKVVARTTLRLCRVKECPGSCGSLHLCKHFLFSGACHFSRRGQCTFSHELNSPHNQEVQQRNKLEILNMQELCTLLLQNDPSLLPQICHDYNNGDGEFGNCGSGDACERMHICEKSLTNNCECFLVHDFRAPQPEKCLRKRGVHNSLFDSLKSTYANKEILKYDDRQNRRRNPEGFRGKGAVRGNRAKSCTRAQMRGAISMTNLSLLNLYDGHDGLDRNDRSVRGRGRDTRARPARDKTEICMFFVKGRCINEDNCFKAHDKMPYRWQIQEGNQWTSLPNNVLIESEYGDPKKTSSSSSPFVDFDTMTSGDHKVRRLSTLNSVTEKNYILTTEWLWYWEDESDLWHQYASAGGGNGPADVNSTQLEEKFLKDNTASVQFTAYSQSYSLSFQDMIQTNVKYGTKKLVRRRPRFVSEEDVKEKKARRPTGQPQFSAVPTHWDNTEIREQGYKMIPLSATSKEYREVEAHFGKTINFGFVINKIERIQSKELWDVFNWQKNRMKERSGEKRLFHGTDTKHVDAICHHNFDWRICGTHGTAYGQGSYFARDAKYSDSYTGVSVARSMFLSRVLVGDYTRGLPDYRRPPAKLGSNVDFYDSCVDNLLNPSIFVIFEKHQIYPEYLIQYTKGATSPQLIPVVPTTPAKTTTGTQQSALLSSNPPRLVVPLTPAKTTAGTQQSALLSSNPPRLVEPLTPAKITTGTQQSALLSSNLSRLVVQLTPAKTTTGTQQSALLSSNPPRLVVPLTPAKTTTGTQQSALLSSNLPRPVAPPTPAKTTTGTQQSALLSSNLPRPVAPPTPAKTTTGTQQSALLSSNLPRHVVPPTPAKTTTWTQQSALLSSNLPRHVVPPTPAKTTTVTQQSALLSSNLPRHVVPPKPAKTTTGTQQIAVLSINQAFSNPASVIHNISKPVVPPKPAHITSSSLFSSLSNQASPSSHTSSTMILQSRNPFHQAGISPTQARSLSIRPTTSSYQASLLEDSEGFRSIGAIIRELMHPK